MFEAICFKQEFIANYTEKRLFIKAYPIIFYFMLPSLLKKISSTLMTLGWFRG